MKKWILSGVVAAAATGAAVFLLTRHPPKIEARPAAPPALPGEAIFTGRVETRSVVSVNTPIPGILDNFFVEPGAQVIADQLLGRVRDPKGDAALQQQQADLDQAQARLIELNGEQLSARLEVSRADAERSRAQGDLDRLQKAYERQKGLWAAGATARLTFEKSEKDYNDAKSAMSKLETAAKDAAEHAAEIAKEIDSTTRAVTEKTSAIERAKAQSVAGELHSPADGIVAARHGQPGDMVEAGAKLIDLATDLTALQAIVTPDAANLARIHANQSATVHLGDEEIAGVVQEVRGGEVVVYFNSAVPVEKLNEPAQVKIKF